MKNFHPVSILVSLLFISGCYNLPQNSLPLYQRSVLINDPATSERIISKARVEKTNDSLLNHIKVLYLKGTPYEMGFQHGTLLKDDVNACIYHFMRKIRFYATEEMLDEAWDLMAPHIPVEEHEEMRGLAHGAEIPLRLVHWFHAVPEVTEYKRRSQFTKKFKGTSCSNIAAFGDATKDGGLYQLRVLDWNRGLGVQKWPVVIVRKPHNGYSSVIFSYAGFTGCVSGMNSRKIALGEMGYGSMPNETLEGMPFVFLFKKLLKEASNLIEVRSIVKNSPRTCSYVFLASDGKSETERAILLVSNRDSVNIFGENQTLIDYRNSEILPPFKNLVYVGARKKELIETLKQNYGSFSVETLKTATRRISLKSNIQNVIFKPKTMETWVSNASGNGKSEGGKACNQKWFYFNFGKHIR